MTTRAFATPVVVRALFILIAAAAAVAAVRAADAAGSGAAKFAAVEKPWDPALTTTLAPTIARFKAAAAIDKRPSLAELVPALRRATRREHVEALLGVPPRAKAGADAYAYDL